MKNAKKIVFKFLATSIILFSFSSCGEGSQKPQEEPPIVEAPAQIIEIDQARTEYVAYEKRRVPLIQHYEDSINRTKYDKMQQNDGAPKPFDVARYVYYDYKTIKQYIAYIEQEAKAADVEISTLRFYFSNNPDEAFFPGTKDPVIHPRQNSVMLSPTLKKDSQDFIFYIDDSTGEKPKAVLLNSNFEPMIGNEMGDASSENNKSYASFLPSLAKPSSAKPVAPYQSDKSLILNEGNSAPPPNN